MKVYNKLEFELLSIQIGCTIKFNRLKKGLSQLDLANQIDSNPTMIGRIERASHIASWDKIILISQHLDIGLAELFLLKNEKDILKLISNVYKLETKLTNEKSDYYKNLEVRIKEIISLIK